MTPVVVLELRVIIPSYDVRSDLDTIRSICDRLQDFIKEVDQSSYFVKEVRWSEDPQ